LSVVEIENPTATVLRLIESRIRVIKDDGGLASVVCSQGNYDRELLKNCDAQVTLSKTADPCLPQKITLDGKLRRRNYALRATIVSTDKSAPGSEPGRVTRDKVLEQILLIIPENRNQPYRTIYNFWPLNATSTTHKAFDAAAETELSPSDPAWTELSHEEYGNLWSSDNLKHTKSTSAQNEFAQMLFRFKVGIKAGETRNEPRRQCLARLVLIFEGHGTTPAGNGVTVKVWDNDLATWTNAQSGTAGTDETLTISLTSDVKNYVDSDGFLYLLARTTNPSDGNAPAVLNSDYIQVTFDVRGIAFCDVHSYRDVDVVDVKPFLWKEEIMLTAWLIESIAAS
jgi:hypothetical protein